MKLPIQTARWIALGIGLPSLFLLLVLLRRLYFSSQENELERLKLWYGSNLIEARDPSLLTRSDTIEIASLDGLANLAEQDQRTILYLPDEEAHHLFVQTQEQLYHYEINNGISPKTLALATPKKTKGRFSFPKLFDSQRNKQLKAAYEHALKGWADAVDKRLSIEGQSHRVAEIAYQLARELGNQGKELEDIRMAAYLHKIGLMDVPNKIVEKKNKLTEKELEILRNHPVHARQHLNQSELLKPIAEAIYYQHERWDGSGQPEGLVGKDIPIGARVITLVNIWSGLSQKRRYRGAWEHKEICRYFSEQAGKQFNPEIIEVFLASVLKFDTSTCEKLVEVSVLTTEEK